MYDDSLYYFHTPSQGPMRPIGNMGDWVVVYGPASVIGYRVYRLASRAAIFGDGGMVVNGGALAAGAVNQNQQTDSVLDLTQGVLGQFRARVLDPITVEILQPAGAQGHNMNHGDTVLTPYNGGQWDENTELYVQDNTHRLSLNITNPGIMDLQQTRVQFYGYRYQLWGLQTNPPAGGALPGDITGYFTGGSIAPIAQLSNIAALDSWLQKANIGKPVPILMANWGM